METDAPLSQQTGFADTTIYKSPAEDRSLFPLACRNQFWHFYLATFGNKMRREAIKLALMEVWAVYAELAKRPVERACQSRTGAASSR